MTLKQFTVKKALFTITLLMTLGLFSLSLNFWIEVEKTQKYAEATKNNSIFQNKLYETYNILGRQKLLIQYSLSISAKSKAVPSKLRKEIKQLQN